MRIGFDAKRYFKNQTGLGNFSRELVHALASNFPNDEFVLFHAKPAKPLLELPNLRVYSPNNAGIFWRSRGIVRDLNREKIDVFHGLSNEIPMGLRTAGIRSVVTIHDVIFKKFPAFYPMLDRWIYDRKTNYAVKNADAVVATSNATAADIRLYYPFRTESAKVIYQPVQRMFYEKNSSHFHEQTPYFIYVSGFSDRKNHTTLIEAFSHIKNLCDWNLMLVGASGNTLEAVHRFIDHEKLGKRISVITDASTPDLVALMHAASGFVYPSLQEGFGIPLAEGIVCGLPVAASDIPVFRELAGEAAFYFHPNHAREMADAMLRITSGEHSAALLKNHEAVLRKIDPAVVAEQYMQVYKS